MYLVFGAHILSDNYCTVKYAAAGMRNVSMCSAALRGITLATQHSQRVKW